MTESGNNLIIFANIVVVQDQEQAKLYTCA